ncbi:MAG: DNA mismatch repair protein MutS [Bacilli bacterium]|nr:DNA mismatch repair protein MutS [Bacilli bacterium]
MKEKYSPMMMQYLEIKKQNPDTLILFRLGDFYELFFDDAKIASRVLELVLTGKNAGVKERVPMCGVPYHAVTQYVDKLIKNGYKVGIVEQLEDPKDVKKGIVKRDVVQIITPGTLIDVGLNETNNNYIVSVESYGSFYVLAYCDISTGELGVLNIENDNEVLLNEIDTLEAKEIVVSSSFDTSIFAKELAKHKFTISYEEECEPTLDFENLVMNLNDIRQIRVVCRLVSYLLKTQKRSLDYLQSAKVIKTKAYLAMDVFTRFNLELTRTQRSDDRYGSLLWVLDKTKTAMGARLLKSYIVRPLSDLALINERLDYVSSFVNAFIARKEIGELLKEVYDLPRLIARIGYGNANGKDLVQLARSLKVVPSIKDALNNSNDQLLINLSTKLNSLDNIVNLIDSAIVENPPFSIKEGGIIRRGFNSDLDELYKLSKGGKEWLNEFENKEKERTGIKTLKVGFNKVFGFYIEVSKGQLPLVKEEFNYIRKQTLTTGERFITPELKEKEELILTSEEKSIKLEYALFNEIREEIQKYTEKIQTLSEVLSFIDVLRSFAEVSVDNNYVRPSFNNLVYIKEGRHPVLEKVLKNSEYVSNDLYLDEDNFLKIITGPNMGGKSTFMRQIALIVIMAQIGCFVPCKEATLKVFDKIFTRIGASDDLVSGQSTFMVEMLEANHALRNASKDSLIIFDEIGRGTSTFDGMALAQAIIEYLTYNVKALTLFSTHYHELTSLEKELKGVKNIHVDVYEENDEVTFLYKIKEGPANKSYGINVARLASLPQELLDRASSILTSLEKNKVDVNNNKLIVKEVIKESQIEQKLKEVDLLNMSPLDALNFLFELKKEVK